MIKNKLEYQDTAVVGEALLPITLFAEVNKDGRGYSWCVRTEQYFESTKETFASVCMSGKSTHKQGAILACREAFLKNIRRM